MLEKLSSGIKDFLGGSNEFVESATIAAEDRITSPFYGYFLISWFLVNWRLPYAAFFVDEEKLFERSGLLRNEYLDLLTPAHSIYPFNVSATFVLHFFVYPFILTLFFFWVSPLVTRHFFRKNIRNKKQLKVIELQESREIKEKELEIEKQKTAIVEERVERAKTASETPEVIWFQDFEIFKESKLFDKFQQIIDSVYKHGGRIRSRTEESVRVFEIDNDLLVYADSNELIEIDQVTRKITLRDKGRFFVKKYSELKNTPGRTGIWG